MTSEHALIDEMVFLLLHVSGLGASDLSRHAALSEPRLRQALSAGTLPAGCAQSRIMQAAFLELQRGMSSMPCASAPVADLSLRISRLEHRLRQQGARALLLWRACLQDRVEEADDADAARLDALLAPPDALASDHAVPSLPHADAYAALVALLRSEARMHQAQPGSAAISGAVLEAARLLDAAAMAWRELIATAPELGPAAGRQLHAMCETSAHALMWLRAADAAQRHLSPEQGAPWLGRADAVAARLAARLALQLAELRSLGEMASALESGVD